MATAGRFAAAVSLRGHGSSEGRDSLWLTGLAEFQDDLADAIRAMPSPPVVVAHSLGGLLAQQILGRTVAGTIGIRGLVLVGSLPPEGLALMAPWLTLTTWLAVLSGTVDLRRASSFIDRHRRSGDGAWDTTLAAAYAAYSGDVAFTGLVQALIPQLVAPAWLARVPALALHGADDTLIDRATAVRTAAYHNADYLALPEAGHYPMLGRHAIAGADALLGWMQNRSL